MESYLGGTSALEPQVDADEVQDELGLFLPAVTAREIVGSQYIQLLPKESVIRTSPTLTFESMASNLPHYIQFKDTYLSLKLSLKKRNVATGAMEPLTLEDNVALLSGVPDTFFSKVSVWLNSSLVTSANTEMRHVFCHMSRILSFQQSSFSSFLETEGSFFNEERESNTQGKKSQGSVGDKKFLYRSPFTRSDPSAASQPVL